MIYDITPFSIIDYPNQISCIVWISGCNMRCQYCYNEHIIYGKANISKEDYEGFLKSRIGLLDGVVFSGGECTQSPNLLEYVSIAKHLGYLIKIDSNGSNPIAINNLVDSKMVDFFAIDFKATKEKFSTIAGYDYFDDFSETLDILITKNADFEVRTTWHFDLLSVKDILQMNDFLRQKGYKNKYYLQKFVEVPNIADLKQSVKLIDLSKFNDDFEFRNFDN